MAGEETRAEGLRDLEARLHIFEALVQVLDDAHRFVDVVRGCDEDSDMVEALRDAFGLSQVQAMAVVEMQFRRIGRRDRLRMRSDLDDMRAERDRLLQS